MSRLEIGVGVIVVTYTGKPKILLGKRKGAHGAGFYAAPGGKPHDGKSPKDCAYRELLEETNLRARSLVPVDFWHYDEFPETGQRFVTIFFDAVVENPSALKTMEPEKCEGWEWHGAGVGMPAPVWSALMHALPRSNLLAPFLR